ncbi:hypothetical protein V1521DRAFT_418046 [Lipomyces starkeyi]
MAESARNCRRPGTRYFRMEKSFSETSMTYNYANMIVSGLITAVVAAKAALWPTFPVPADECAAPILNEICCNLIQNSKYNRRTDNNNGGRHSRTSWSSYVEP